MPDPPINWRKKGNPEKIQAGGFKKIEKQLTIRFRQNSFPLELFSYHPDMWQNRVIMMKQRIRDYALLINYY